MGTSSAYGGPSGAASLLPPWTDLEVPALGVPLAGPPAETPHPEAPAASPPVIPVITWDKAKAAMTRFASSGGASTTLGRRRLRSAARAYVRAHNGARGAAQAARHGRATAQRLGAFLGSIVEHGVAATVERFRLQDFISRRPEDLLAAVLDIITPPGSEPEAAAARAAGTDTLAELFGIQEGVEGNTLDAFESLGLDDIRVVFQKLLANYICERLVQTLARKLEGQATADVIRLEQDIRAFVTGTIELDLQGVNPLHLDWEGEAGRRFIQRIYQDGFTLISL